MHIHINVLYTEASLYDIVQPFFFSLSLNMNIQFKDSNIKHEFQKNSE